MLRPFASLMDQDNHALDVFDVWRALFPEKEDAVVATWKRVEPHLQLIRDYRNDISFHANKNARRYFETRRRFFENQLEIMQAMQDFWNLAAQLIRHQITALPDFREEMKPILKAALPDWDDKQLEELTDYFVQSRILPVAVAAKE